MAVAVAILPPVELIPILWFLEMAASLLMARGGWRDAYRRAAITLVIGNWIGWPFGLWLTTSISVASSKATVLIVVLALAATQLARVRLKFMATGPGTLFTGIVVCIIAGLAHLGGMVVALYALSRQADAKTMRGTLVTFLFVGSFGSLVYQIAFGVMDQAAVARGLGLVIPTVAGVWMGQSMFVEKLQQYYRPFCLGYWSGWLPFC